MQDAKLIASLLRAAGAQKEWTEETRRTKRATDDAEKSLDRFAASIKKIDVSPTQTYRQNMDLLTKALQAGKISQEEFERASRRFLEAQRAADPFYQQQIKTQRAQKQAADEAAAAQIRSAKAAQQARSQALDAGIELAGSLGIITTAAGGAAAAVQMIGEGFRFASEQARKAADEMDKLFALRRSLNQVADSPEHLQQMMSQADAGAQKYGVSREQAHAIMADVVGLGIEKDFETILAANAGAVSAPDASRMVKKTLAIYKDRDPALTARSSIDMTLAAARKSELSFEDLASGVAQASEGGAVVGSSAEETISMLSVLGGKFASVQTAADRMKGFSARSGTNDRLKGKGTLGAFRTLRDEFSDEERKKFLGDSQELNIMYQMLLENEGAIVTRQGEVTSARSASDAGTGEVTQALIRAQKTPQIAATVAKQRSEVGLKIAEEQRLGTFGQRQQGAYADVEALGLNRGDSGWTRATAAFFAKRAQDLGFDEGGIRTAGEIGRYSSGLGMLFSSGPAQQGPVAAGGGDSMQAAAAKMVAAADKQLEAANKNAKRPIHPAAQIEAAQPIT